jgi:hypothetical protein
MRAIAILAAVCLTVGPAWAAGLQDDFAAQLAGPWGRVDVNWQPYTGALAKNSCPPGGVRQPSTVGLFGDGGTMWIESVPGGSLKVHDGSSLVRTFMFVRLETGSAAVYRDGAAERRLSLVAADRLSEERLPAVAGVPSTKYARCKKRK